MLKAFRRKKDYFKDIISKDAITLSIYASKKAGFHMIRLLIVKTKVELYKLRKKLNRSVLNENLGWVILILDSIGDSHI